MPPGDQLLPWVPPAEHVLADAQILRYVTYGQVFPQLGHCPPSLQKLEHDYAAPNGGRPVDRLRSTFSLSVNQGLPPSLCRQKQVPKGYLVLQLRIDDNR